MCESIMTYLLKETATTGILVSSAGTSSEEYGNPTHRGTVEVLFKHGIRSLPHRAVNLTPNDYQKYDMFVCMDSSNIRACKRIFGDDRRVFSLMEFTGKNRDVADPWYTGDFDKTFEDCYRGCVALLDHLLKNDVG